MPSLPGQPVARLVIPYAVPTAMAPGCPPEVRTPGTVPSAFGYRSPNSVR